jgi:uroporphyrinogen-III synthase
MRRIVVLRPEPGASETVRKARERGLDAVAIPLFDVGPLSWRAPDPAQFDGLLLTSANAVRHGGEALARLRDLPAYAVGGATADAAREAGFGVAAVGDGGVEPLLSSLDPNLRLLHLCGEHRRSPANPPQQITPVIVYRSRERPAPDMGAAQDAVALIHSPRAGRRFAELISDASSIAIAAISSAAVDSVGTGWESVEVADRPTDDALLALAERLCNKPPQR